jgi:hypothetical protein
MFHKEENTMAKDPRNSGASSGDNGNSAPTTPAPEGAPAAAAVATNDDRYRKVSVDNDGSTFAYNDGSKNGQAVNRIDYIRAAWKNGKARGAIAKELTRMTGKKVAYQIVFSATKGQPGGPPPSAATPAAATAPQG